MRRAGTSRRDFLHRAGAAAGIALTAAGFCSRASSGAASAGDAHQQAASHARALSAGREITLKILIPNGSRANVEPATRWFSANAGVQFALEEVPVDEIVSRMTIDALSGQGKFDLALPATFGIPDLARAKALLPLDELAARYAPADFSQSMLYQAGDRHDGALFGYQTDGDVYLMFYRMDWLEDRAERDAFADRHGVPLTAPQTWQDLDRLLAWFHRPENGRFGGTLFRTPLYMVWEFWCRMHARGALPFEDDMTPGINSDAAVEALEDLLAASAYLHPRVGELGLFENWKVYAEGNTFANIGWGGTQKFLRGATSAVRDKLLHAPPPGGLVNGKSLKVSYFNWGWTYAVSARSSESEIAYLFTLAATSPALSTQAVAQTEGYFDPFRREHYADARIVEAYGAPFLGVHRSAMESCIPDLYLPAHGQYMGALRRNIARAAGAETSARAALDVTARHWSRITREQGLSQQLTHWQHLLEAYPAVYKTLQ